MRPFFCRPPGTGSALHQLNFSTRQLHQNPFSKTAYRDWHNDPTNMNTKHWGHHGQRWGFRKGWHDAAAENPAKARKPGFCERFRASECAEAWRAQWKREWKERHDKRFKHGGWGGSWHDSKHGCGRGGWHRGFESGGGFKTEWRSNFDSEARRSFNWHAFSRGFRKQRFQWTCHEEFHRYWDPIHAKRRHARRIRRAARRGQRMMGHEARLRAKTGLAYFLASHIPHAPPHFHPSVATAPIQLPLPQPAPPTPPPTHRRPQSPLTRAPYTPGTHTFPLRTSLLSLPLRPLAPQSSLSARLFSTSQRRSCSSVILAPFERGFPIFVPLLALLKSSSALNAVTVISRVALTLLPLSVRAKVIHAARELYAKNPDAWGGWLRKIVERGGTVATSGAGMRYNAQFILPFLVSLPVLLLGATVLASYERTPVTGRPRIVMLSPSEEIDLVTSVLSVGENAGQRDWVTILRNVLDLNDEGRSPTTGRRLLLGGEVLDERDWRFRWTEAVLRALESGVPALASTEALPSTAEGVLVPPPSKYPLAARPSTSTGGVQPLQGALLAEYDLLVIDRKEANAFSFGFGPEETAVKSGRRGVIVVYTGFIDEILGQATSQPAAPSFDPVQPTAQMTSFFGNLFPSRRPAVAEPLPNIMPTTLPTPAQTKSLAVLLSHELAHLVLSHTLESYASTSLLIPHVSKMLSDVFRTIVYPFTAALGPFFNDAIGNSMKEGASDGFGILGHAVSTCESRTLEGEADLVALRLLANSGIDPRFALNFWEERLATPTNTVESSPQLSSHPSSHLLRLHSEPMPKATAESACGFLRTHPVNEERVAKIRAEIERWMSLQEFSLRS